MRHHGANDTHHDSFFNGLIAAAWYTSSMGDGKRKRQREPTRDRMLDAAVELLRNEGLPALTTVRVTKEAGIVQSGFYAHFKNPEHLQEALAERVGARLRERLAAWMAELRVEGEGASLTARYRAILDRFSEDAAIVDLFLRFRRSQTPLGRVLAHLHTQLRADFFQYLRDRAGSPEPRHLGAIGVHADTLVAALLGVAEGIVDGRLGDLDTAAAELDAITHEPLRRLLAEI